jgi:nitroreductase
MDILTLIRSRKSIRGFLSKPVEKKILAEILSTACRGPSAMNTQPWEFAVLAGDSLREAAKQNVALLRSGAMPCPEHVVVGWKNDSVYRERQVDLAKRIFLLMGIERQDKEKRAAWLERGFRYFDAPAAIILLTDRDLPEPAPLLDLGALLENICLAALHFGLGTCIEDQGVMYPQVLRKIAGIPDSRRIVIAIAIGYPDPLFPANELESPREDVQNITRWVGFD